MIISIEQQIAILELAMKKINDPRSMPGLCFAIRVASIDLLPDNTPIIPLSELIPVFTFENAKLFGANELGLYWWPSSEIKIRVYFLEWMISELKKQL